jgi:DNA-binding transcriptional MerR regulator
MSEEGEELYTSADVAREFNVSRQAVVYWIRGGVIHPFGQTRMPGGYIFRKSEIDRLHNEGVFQMKMHDIMWDS